MTIFRCNQGHTGPRPGLEPLAGEGALGREGEDGLTLRLGEGALGREGDEGLTLRLGDEGDGL